MYTTKNQSMHLLDEDLDSVNILGVYITWEKKEEEKKDLRDGERCLSVLHRGGKWVDQVKWSFYGLKVNPYWTHFKMGQVTSTQTQCRSTRLNMHNSHSMWANPT